MKTMTRKRGAKGRTPDPEKSPENELNNENPNAVAIDRLRNIYLCLSEVMSLLVMDHLRYDRHSSKWCNP